MKRKDQQELMRRYLDGELTGEEADLFLEALDADSELEAELVAYERVQVIASGLGEERVPDGFTDRVMQQLKSSQSTRGMTRPRGGRSRTVWAIAASIVIGFGIGRAPLGASRSTGPREVSPSSVSVVPLAFLPGTIEGRSPRVVRMTYVPTDSGTRSVSVAGSFNDWNPERVSMTQENGVWSAVLVLPAGTHEYMFLEDGERWVTDPLARRTRDDGFGGRNAVLDIGV